MNKQHNNEAQTLVVPVVHNINIPEVKKKEKEKLHHEATPHKKNKKKSSLSSSQGGAQPTTTTTINNHNSEDPEHQPHKLNSHKISSNNNNNNSTNYNEFDVQLVEQGVKKEKDEKEEGGLEENKEKKRLSIQLESRFNIVVNQKTSEIVKLNIGGYQYETTFSTLTCIPDTYFSLLLSGRFPFQKDERGAFFIDRDGQYFAPILTFLRTGEVIVPPNMTLKDIKREAEYFLIEPLLLKINEFENHQKMELGKNLFSANQQRNKALEEFFGPDISNPTTEYIITYLNQYHAETCNLLKELRNESGALQVLLHVCTGEHPPRLEALKVWRGRQIYSNPIGISIGLECKASPRAVEVIADYLMGKGFSGKVWHSQSIHCSQCSSSSTNILLCWNHHARIIDDFGSCCKPVTDYRFGTSVVSLQNENDFLTSSSTKSTSALNF